jgi:hypothetical protein
MFFTRKEPDWLIQCCCFEEITYGISRISTTKATQAAEAFGQIAEHANPPTLREN